MRWRGRQGREGRSGGGGGRRGCGREAEEVGTGQERREEWFGGTEKLRLEEILREN